MVPMRKTATVEFIKHRANFALNDASTLKAQEDQHGERGAIAYRQGVAAVLESVLMDTGNYKGFMFTDGEHGLSDNSRRTYF